LVKIQTIWPKAHQAHQWVLALAKADSILAGTRSRKAGTGAVAATKSILAAQPVGQGFF